MPKYEVRVFPDDKQVAETAAKDWLDCLAGAEKSKPFLVALSGGRIARTFFSSVATLGKGQRELFGPVHFFWGDERCVPPGDPESNYRVAQELMFTPLNLREKQLHRIRGEDAPEAAASRAEKELLAVAPRDETGLPVLDLIFLGMGEDGHVASLFPGDPCIGAENEAVYRAVRAAKPPPQRITLGLGVVCAACQVWVLASGAGKEVALRKSLQNDAGTPLGRVLQKRENTRILTDIAV